MQYQFEDIYLKSDNNSGEYPTYPVATKDIAEIWQAKLKISTDFSPPLIMEDRLASLETDLEILKMKMGKG